MTTVYSSLKEEHPNLLQKLEVEFDGMCLFGFFLPF